MLTVISGRFHPDLENGFTQRITELKTDPLTSVLVVAPSTRLIERLQVLLASTRVSSLNIQFHSISSLIEKMVALEGPLHKPILSDPLFYDTLVKQILKREVHFPEMENLAVPNGFPPAVRSSLRDLLDAGINEDNVEDAIREEFVGKPVDLGSLRSLLHLYRSYLKKIKTLPVLPRSELIVKATEGASRSSYLSQFKEIQFYGLYDMTGLQFNWFESIAKNYPTRFYFPYVKNNQAYSFSKRFRDTFLQIIPHEPIFISEENEAKDRLPSAIMSVSGFQDEAWAVASEIIRLHEEEKIPFSDMAVISRTEDRLRESLQDTFRHSYIPFRSFAKETLGLRPQVQMAVQLLESVDHDLDPGREMDFLSFPEFRLPKEFPAFEGLALWPVEDSWTGYASKAEQILKQYFEPSSEESRKVWHLIFDSLKSIDQFEKISPRVDRREFLETLFEKWNRLELENEKNNLGVSLLYAEAARGIPFKVVFLIGLEEKVFPRLIREDPFLRDNARYELNATLGHKIGEKAAALEEERLLFQLFIEAATNKLYLIYRRSDEDGNVVGASPFLRSFAEENNFNLKSLTQSLQRPLVEKIKIQPPSTLSLTAVTTGFLAGGRPSDAIRFLEAANHPHVMLERGIEMRALLQTFDSPGPIDGFIGPLAMKKVFKDGFISATALEIYGRCPFQYFAGQMLGLKALDEISLDESPESAPLGKAVHRFLERFYKEGLEKNHGRMFELFPDSIFEDVFASSIGVMTAKDLNTHPVLWEASKIALKEKLRRFVQNDILFCKENGFQPIAFERGFSASLPPFNLSWNFRGRLDRIDRATEELVVIDYKTGKYTERSKVALEALRGQKSQAPLYVLMAEELYKKKSAPTPSFSFRYVYPLEDKYTDLTLSSQEWQFQGKEILKTIESQIQWMTEGQFGMVPEDRKCSWCQVSQACRRNHGVSSYRSRQGEGSKFWALRESVHVKSDAEKGGEE